MYETAAEAWHGWGRSLALPGVDPRRAPARRPGDGRPGPGAAARARWSPRRADVARRRPAGGARRHARRDGPGLHRAAASPTGCRRSPTSLAVAALVRSTVATPAGVARPRRSAPGHPEAQADERHERAGRGRAARPVDDELGDRVGTRSRPGCPGPPSRSPARRRAPAATAARRRGAATARRPRRRAWRRCARRGSGRTAARRGRPSPPPRRRSRATTRRGRATARPMAAPADALGDVDDEDRAARRAGPSSSLAFHQPGLRSPTARRSTCRRRPTMTAVGIDPSR